MAFTLIHESRISHTGSGMVLEDDLYIKLDARFDDLVAELGRGGQLPALIHIQLREAHASSARGNPATLKTIANAASCRERQAQRIVKSLLEKCLITEAGISPSTGEKFYRPLGYAWFGNKRIPAGVSPMTPQDKGGVKCHPPDTVVVDVNTNNNPERVQQTAQTREILKKCGILGKPLERLAENVELETARLWLEWVESDPPYLRNPVGVAVSALLADPDARPVVKEKKQAAPRVGRISGHLAGKFQPSEDESEETA